ncbi:MAG: hypothetical protein SGILL_003051, partial [Bacillariaceae sp.]
AGISASTNVGDRSDDNTNSESEGACETGQDGTCLWHQDDDDEDDDDDDDDDDTYSFYNPEMHADNILEVDVPVNVIHDIRRGYEGDIAPFYNTNHSTEDFCLVAPYAPGVKTWGSFVDVDEARSDIRWYSVNNLSTYEKYRSHVERLGLLDRVREHKMIPAEEELTVLSIFFIPRSFSKSYQFHEDWPEEVGSQVVTFLMPLSDDFSIDMVYRDADEEVRHYNYTLGKAIGVGGGLLHSTGTGQAKTQNVLLCVYIGGKNEEMWDYALDTISDELEYYQDPFRGFVRNENLKGGKSKCQ